MFYSFYNQNTEKERTTPLSRRFDLNISAMPSARHIFDFFKQDIHRLSQALQIPGRFVLPNRCVEDGIQSLCIFVARLAYPNRLSHLEHLFNRPQTTISLIIQAVLDFIYDNFHQKINVWNRPSLTNRFQQFADAVHRKGAPLRNCVGFVDGTVRPLCRPTYFQRACYSGHKKVHAIKF